MMENSKSSGYEWQTVQPHHPLPLRPYHLHKTPLSILHSRLSNLYLEVLKSIVSSALLPVLNSLSFFHWNDCLIHKIHKTPFSLTSFATTKSLELVFSNIWTSPILSVDAYKYYVIFVDHFTHYIWVYPICKKSDTKEVFIK